MNSNRQTRKIHLGRILALTAVMLTVLGGSLMMRAVDASAAVMPDWAAEFDGRGDAFEGVGGGGGSGWSRSAPWNWNLFASRCDDLLADLVHGMMECERIERARWLIEPLCRDFPEARSTPACTDPTWWILRPY